MDSSPPFADSLTGEALAGDAPPGGERSNVQEALLAALKELSYLRDMPGVMAVVRRVARELTRADGVSFVLREDDRVYYAEENAVGPLWKGRRFPASACISGWVMINRRPAVIEDIYQDPRIPLDAYRATFVRSLMMVPIRSEDPIGAIGAYWATRRQPLRHEIEVLQALADATAVAVANAELYAQAQQAIAARDEFIAIAAHELRTPLTSLGLLLQGLARGASNDGRLRDIVARSLRQSKRLNRLVEHLLGVSPLFSHWPAGLDPEPLDLSRLVQEVIESLQEDAAMAGSALVLHAPESLPGCWDRRGLEQVLTNLLTNALKYGAGQQVAVTLSLTDAAPPRVQICVQDHGIGIAPEDVERIFERFARAVSSQNYGGLGLGLYVSRTIIESHGGTIVATSQPGVRTVFTVELPLDARPAAASA